MNTYFQSILKSYLTFLKFEKGLADNTIISYQHDLNVYLKYVISSGCNNFQDINSHHLSDFFFELNALSLTDITQNRYLSAIRSFHIFLLEENIIDTNFTTKFELHKTTRKIPNILTLQQIDNLLDAVNTSTPTGIRDKTIIEILYACGLRVSELINLKIQDVLFSEELIRIMGKGNKERIVPIGSEALH